MSEPPRCPNDGRVLAEAGGGRFLSCSKCRFVFDSWLSRVAVYDEWNSSTKFLKPKTERRRRKKGSHREIEREPEGESQGGLNGRSPMPGEAPYEFLLKRGAQW